MQVRIKIESEKANFSLIIMKQQPEVKSFQEEEACTKALEQ